MRIAIATDAWPPQVNGVVTTVTTMRRMLEARGHTVEVIHPYRFLHIPCPTYAELPWAILPRWKTARILDRFEPEAVHIVNEGPVGQAARAWCLKNRFPFTTVFTTKYPEYIHMRFGIPLGMLYRWFLNFHNAAARTCVATKTLKDELEEKGFRNLVYWERGVDTDRFRPRAERVFTGERPLLLTVGRVAPEKNLPAFLSLDVPGTKMVVGRGPALRKLRRRFPKAIFTGLKTGEELAALYADADAFVFPSLTDTFGIVLLESLASGVPVAACPVVGPKDILEDGVCGALDTDLGKAVERALRLGPEACRARAMDFPWERSLEQLLGNLVPAHDAAARLQPA